MIKEKIREQYGRDAVSVAVEPESKALANRCFRNVADKVREDGGTSQFGWMFFHHPIGDSAGLVIALHHAVWRSANGKLIDITPHAGEPVVMDGDKLLFVIDDSATPIQAEGCKIGLCRPCDAFALTKNRAVRELVRHIRRAEWEYGHQIGLAT